MAFAAAAAIAAAGAAAYGAYETGQASQRGARAQANALALQRRQQDIADRQAEANFAPTTNARGDRTEYIPGVGWVETPSSTTQSIINASDNEELLRLTQDQPRARMNREANFRQQQEDRGLAGALLARTNEGTRSLADVEAGAVREGVARQTAGPDSTNSALLINALRQGSGGIDALRFANTGNQSSTRAVLEGARNQAPRMFADNESARLNDGLNRYSGLMTRATADPGVPFQPTQLADALTGSRMAQQRTAPYGTLAAMGVKEGTRYDTDSTYGNQAGAIIKALEQGYRGYQRYAGGTAMNGGTMQTNTELANALLTPKPDRQYSNDIKISRGTW